MAVTVIFRDLCSLDHNGSDSHSVEDIYGILTASSPIPSSMM